MLQNIPVLATGTEIEQKGKNEKPVQVDVITLELTPAEAEKLALATSEGKIQLALRNFNSSEEVSTHGETISSLLSGQTIQARPAVQKARTPKPVVLAKKDPTIDIEVFQGSDKSVKTFKAEEK